MDFSTVESVPVELLGRVRHLRLTLSAPGWYKAITHKPLLDLIMFLRRQMQVGMAAKRTNEAHAEALGVSVEQLPPEEMVDPDILMEPKDNIDMADMIPDVLAAIYALAHWEDVQNRPQGRKDTPLPGELTLEDMAIQLDLDACSMLVFLIIQVYGLHAMKAGKDTKNDPNPATPEQNLTPPSSGELDESSSDSQVANS